MYSFLVFSTLVFHFFFFFFFCFSFFFFFFLVFFLFFFIFLGPFTLSQGFSLLGAYRIAMQALSVAQQKLLIHMS